MEILGPGPTATDTPVFIYFIEEHPEFLPLIKPIFEEADRGDRRIVVSALTLVQQRQSGPRRVDPDRGSGSPRGPGDPLGSHRWWLGKTEDRRLCSGDSRPTAFAAVDFSLVPHQRRK
jgi:hypothetical protein